jgi:hypothetical protein
MVLQIDTRFALRTPDEYAALVEAVVNADPVSDNETHWLEWKGPLPIDKAEGQFSIAKAILAFANREPSPAASVCEGTAYMIVGAEPGSAPGVTPIDHADLGQGVRKYTDGPRWSPHYVRHGNATVLLVVVEAPRRGDPIHVLGKTYNSFAAGTIFHRGTAQSEPAGPKEVAMLQQRLLEGARAPGLALGLSASADPLTRLLIPTDDVKAWLEEREAYVRANAGAKPTKPKPTPKPPEPPEPPHQPWMPGQPLTPGNMPRLTDFTKFTAPNIATSIGAAFLADPYAKPGELKEFEKRVQTHMAQCRHRLIDNVVRKIFRSGNNDVTLAVANETDDPITAVVVTARVPKTGLEVFVSLPSADPMPEVPMWPTDYDRLLDQGGRAHTAAVMRAASENFHTVNAEVIKDDACFEISWNVGNLLAWTSAEISATIIPGPSAPDQIDVDLSVRAMSHRGVSHSSCTLEVAPASDAWRVTNWCRPDPT